MRVMKDYVYMLCTSDRLELPLIVGSSLKEIEEYSGIKASSISTYLAKGKRKMGRDFKIIKINLSEEN